MPSTLAVQILCFEVYILVVQADGCYRVQFALPGMSARFLIAN